MKKPRRLAAAAAPLDAVVEVPPSKSLTNRALIAAAAAGGGTVHKPLDAEDTRLLAQALSRCGWEVDWRAGIEIGPRRVPEATVSVHLGNSGTGSRLLLGLLAASPGRTLVDGAPRLRQRPMAPLLEGLRQLGAAVEADGGTRLPVRVAGRRLQGGTLALAPGASSQFVSALLMTAPLMGDGLVLELRGAIPSRPYLLLTADVLRTFGAEIEHDGEGRRWRVSGGGLRPAEVTVEGDWSAAAFFLAAAAVSGGVVRIRGLRESSAQGDRVMVDLMRAAGVRVSFDRDGLTAAGPARAPIVADLANTPDLFPALAAAAACVPGGSRLTGLEHLRHKESDRLGVMVANLRRLGADIAVEEGGKACRFAGSLAARPAHPREAVELPAADDHRVAMALAVVALRAGPLVVDDAACVAKSFPGFWEQWPETGE